jgi:DNA invertase Pin-like site-specific DNA recombinase
MGLAQREVDVLSQRTADGMEAKLRAGGWPQKAPDKYVNNVSTGLGRQGSQHFTT